jgi:hypothetical protein
MEKQYVSIKVRNEALMSSNTTITISQLIQWGKGNVIHKKEEVTWSLLANNISGNFILFLLFWFLRQSFAM